MTYDEPANERLITPGQDDTTVDVADNLRRPYVEMLVSAMLSLIASLVLSVEAVKLAADPGATFSCDVNAIVSCGKVAKAWQSSLLGFPNAFIGLICEPVVITIAIAGILGVVLPRRMMQVAQVVYTAALIFAWWLFTQSYFVIGAFCPWCLLVTLTTTTVFASMTRINILQNNLGLGERATSRLRRALSFGLDHIAVGLLVSVVTALIIIKYL